MKSLSTSKVNHTLKVSILGVGFNLWKLEGVPPKLLNAYE